MRFLVDVVRALFRFRRRRARLQPEAGLTAVEYEAVTLITLEGQDAFRRACEQAEFCRVRRSEDGHKFWSEVAAEVSLRTKGRLPEER